MPVKDATVLDWGHRAGSSSPRQQADRCRDPFRRISPPLPADAGDCRRNRPSSTQRRYSVVAASTQCRHGGISPHSGSAGDPTSPLGRQGGESGMHLVKFLPLEPKREPHSAWRHGLPSLQTGLRSPCTGFRMVGARGRYSESGRNPRRNWGCSGGPLAET